MTRRWLLLVPIFVFLTAIWYGLGSSHVPSGQPPLAPLDLASLKADFNRASDRVRIIVLLSPT